MQLLDFTMSILCGLRRRRWSPPGGPGPQRPRPGARSPLTPALGAALALAALFFGQALGLWGVGTGHLYCAGTAPASPLPPGGRLETAGAALRRAAPSANLDPATLAHLAHGWERESRVYARLWAAYWDLYRLTPLRGRAPGESSLPAERGRNATSVLWARCPLRTEGVGSHRTSPLVTRAFLRGQGRRAIAPRHAWEALAALGLEVGPLPDRYVGEWLAHKRHRFLQPKV